MRQAIVDRCRDWVDVPFKFNGRTRKGADCVHIIREAIAASGQAPDVAPYTSAGSEVDPGQQITRYAVRIPLLEAKPGDILLLRYKGSPLPHYGILTEKQTIIHALLRARKVCEYSLQHPDVAGHIVAAYRLNGVTD